MSGPLTKTEQVLQVLRSGGTVESRGRGSMLLTLRNADGNEVPAWQNAIKAAARIVGKAPGAVQP